MKVLITGCGGFIGSHLADFYTKRGDTVYGTTFNFDGTRNVDHLKLNLMKCDFKKKEEVESAVRKSKPDVIFHLAAQSFVVPSWEDPENTFNTNVLGTLYLLEAVRKYCPDTKVIVACSSAEYGYVTKKDIPLGEDSEFRPSSPYAVSKVGQDMLSYLYSKAYGMKIIRMRLFNTTGPRKTFDACSDFARGIAEIEKGKRSALTVGNLGGIRDITDVRDSVRAMNIICEKGVYGDVYNICTGKAYKVSDLLDKLVGMSKKKVKIINAPNPMRKVDDPIFVGNNSKIRKLGWKPEIPIETTLSDMLDFWRKN